MSQAPALRKCTDPVPSDLSSDPDPVLRLLWHELASSNPCLEYAPHPGKQDSRLDRQQMEMPKEESESRVDRQRRACFQHRNRRLLKLYDLFSTKLSPD